MSHKTRVPEPTLRSVLALPLILAFSFGVPAGSAKAQVAVTVVDARSGYPVPSAVVRTLDAEGALLASATTDLQGQAFLTEARAAAVSVEALGYMTATVELEERRIIEVRLDAAAIELDSLVV